MPRGEQGELQVAGPSSAQSYRNDGERTRNTFLGPWTRTGDSIPSVRMAVWYMPDEENCRHSPHRDQPDAVIDATVEFLRQF